MKEYPLKLYLNNRRIELKVFADETLLDALRNRLDAVEVKNGCSKGDCGACTVIIDGKAINACLTLALQAEGKNITTIKGIGDFQNPHPIQRSFVEKGAIQCGFCTSGQVMSAKALLDNNPQPSSEEIREAISGNLCRCTGYTKIVEAIEDAANKSQIRKEEI